VCACAAQAQCDDAELEGVVERRIADFVEWVEKHPERRGVTARLRVPRVGAFGVALADAASGAGQPFLLRTPPEAGVVQQQ
jgi:hypothetical protein